MLLHLVLPSALEAASPPAAGLALTVVYTATAASTKRLKGSVDVQPMGGRGTFIATPAPARP